MKLTHDQANTNSYDASTTDLGSYWGSPAHEIAMAPGRRQELQCEKSWRRKTPVNERGSITNNSARENHISADPAPSTQA